MKICDIKTPGQPQTGRTTMQHLAYQPLLPPGNKYLQQKWDKASYDLHRGKVKSAKPTINTTPPRTYSHLSVKLKTKKLKEEWTMKIQRENNILMEKISHIMRTTGGVDNRNYYDRKSLGKEKRQLELLRITKENQMILLHLSQCRSHYNVRSWHEDWLKTLKVMDSIACYPRGRTNRQKGQEKHCDCNKEQKIRHTHSPGKAETKQKIKEEQNRQERRYRNRDTAGRTVATCPQPNAPEKSILPDTPENPSSSDTIQITADKPPHTAETFSSFDGSETSSTPHTTKTLMQKTASPAEG